MSRGGLAKVWTVSVLLVFASVARGQQPIDTVNLATVEPVVQAQYLSNNPAIDGQFDFQSNFPWIPLMQSVSSASNPSIPGWYKVGWNEEGIYIAAAVPSAQTDRLMNTGRTPDAPFELSVRLDVQKEHRPGYPGDHMLRFMPLTHEPDKMLYRNQGFLFNHYLGSDSRLVDDGLVMWGERSLSGIDPGGILARWAPFDKSDREAVSRSTRPNQGISIEIFIPWQNLQGAEDPLQTDTYFNLELSLPGNRSASWIGNMHTERASAGRVKQLQPDVPYSHNLYRENSLLLHSDANVLAGEEFVNVYYPIPDDLTGSLAFALVDSAGHTLQSFDALKYNDPNIVHTRFRVIDEPDGPYRLELRNADQDTTISYKPVFAADSLLRRFTTQRKEMLMKKEQLMQEEVSWRTGQLARAEWLLNKAEIKGSTGLREINQKIESFHRAATILKAVEKGDRPEPANVNYFRPGEFSADGKRGYIHFKAVNDGEARLTIQGDATEPWNVNPLIYGTFSEPVIFDRPVYDLLYGQLLRNPSFEWGHPTVRQTHDQYVNRYDEIDEESAYEVENGNWVPVISTDEDEVAAPWMGVGEGETEIAFAISDVSYNTNQSQRIIIRGRETWGGVAQLTSLPVWRETEYHFKTVLRTAPGAPEKTVELNLYHEGDVVDQAVFKGVTDRWKSFETKLTVPRSNKEQNGFLVVLTAEGPADIYVDQTNMFPADTVGGGLDPQSVEQIKKLKTGWVRWPGGNYASSYHWREGVGPLTERVTRPNPTWIGLNSHYFGTDEYMKFNKLANLEPLITVNAGTGTPEEAAQWVEYANGTTDTPMGQLRAENGHPSPYDVKYWNIGNELWGFWQAGYATPSEYVDRYRNFTKAMAQKDSALEFISIGVGPFSVGTKRWTDMLIEQVNQHHDIIDFHAYVGVPNYLDLDDKKSLETLTHIPVAFEQGLMAFRDRAQEIGQGDLDVIVGEYNNRTDGRMPDQWEEVGDLLTYAGWLHGFIRQGEYVVGANATEYSVFDPRSGEFGGMHPRYQLFKTYREQAGTKPVRAMLETPVRQSPVEGGKDVTPIFNVPVIDAVVLQDSTHQSISIGLINRDLEKSHSIEIDLRDFDPASRATQYLIWDKNAIQDTTDRQGDTKVYEQPIEVSQNFNIQLKPHSVTLIKLKTK